MNNPFTSGGPDLGDTSLPSATANNHDFDTSAYIADLADLNLDEAAKVELLTVLHDIMSHFVQMGFDLKEVDVCGQLFGEFADAALGDSDGVES